MVKMKSTQVQNGTSSDFDTGFLIRRDQASIEAASTPSTLLTNSFIAATAAIMMWQPEAKASLAAWILIVAFVNLLRYLSVLIGLRLRLVERKPDAMLIILASGALVSGISWAILPVLAYFDGFLFNPTMACVISGVTAGKAVLSPVYRHAVWPFILSILASYIACLLIQQDFVSYVLAGDFAIFTVILYRAAVKSEAAFFRLSRMKYEAVDLAVSLRQANDAAFAANKRLEFLANHDSLTGLANRSAFIVALRAAMDRARLNQEEVALLLIDLDRFKSVNDTHGHSAGDQVLVEAARRLRLAVDASDLVARLGGDEFAMILIGPRIQVVAQAAARATVDLLRDPIEVGERLVNVGGSVGVSFFPYDGASVEELQICADVALYAAKSDGRGRVRLFDAKLRAETEARRIYELDLAKALASGAIEVWFQPQVRLSDRQLCGLEALVRWKHAEHGWVPPPEIVSAAAATRQSEALTSRVIDASCQMIRALDDVGHADVNVSFNASPRELGQYSLPDVLAVAITDHAVPPERLEVEITEEAMFQDDRGTSVLHKIAALGVNIAIDDFGVGYSSFGALKRQAFNCIKIDRVFIDGLTSGEDGRALVQAILGVARALGVKAIAEGVETAEQAAILHHLGCPEVQGYFFGRPMPAADLIQWIVAHDQAQPQRELPLFEPASTRRLLSVC
jgi:diguanylate cyclase (GGDEF)-like protein